MYRYENKVYMYNQIVSWERFTLPFDPEIDSGWFLSSICNYGSEPPAPIDSPRKNDNAILQVLEEEVTRGSTRYWPLGYNVLMYMCMCVRVSLCTLLSCVCVCVCILVYGISREQ